MKKLARILLFLTLCTVAYAAVEIALTIPDAYVTRAITALRACENTHVSIHFQGSRDPNNPNVPDFTLDVDYRIDSDPNETHKDYSKRFVATMLRAVIKAYETKVRDEEVQEQIDAIEIPDVNVPDEIIE